jgi:alpha-tubulin suppressor-like RCC1 family protein
MINTQSKTKPKLHHFFRVLAMVAAIALAGSLVVQSARPAEAVPATGPVLAWGYNGSGQLGNGNYNGSPLPVTSILSGDIKAVASGNEHSLALKADGTVWAWGDNLDGQLGNGTSTPESNLPVQVKAKVLGLTFPLTGITAIASGDSRHSLALRNDGTVWALGLNTNGQLGDGTYIDRNTAVKVQGLSEVKAIAVGNQHSLALKTDGTVWAWGLNSSGQLGNGAGGIGAKSSKPVQVSNLSGVKAIAAGTYHSLALKSDGTVWAWGDNYNGQLGTGSYYSSKTPVAVKTTSGSILGGVTSIAAGGYHSLALKIDGTVRAWGENSDGQLGNGVAGTSIPTPVVVSNLSGVKTLAGGVYHSLALKTDGTVRAWGWNFYGQLGDGTYNSSNIPVAVKTTSGSNLSGVKAIAGSIFHSLAVIQ